MLFHLQNNRKNKLLVSRSSFFIFFFFTHFYSSTYPQFILRLVLPLIVCYYSSFSLCCSFSHILALQLPSWNQVIGSENVFFCSTDYGSASYIWVPFVSSALYLRIAPKNISGKLVHCFTLVMNVQCGWVRHIIEALLCVFQINSLLTYKIRRPQLLCAALFLHCDH